MAFDDKPIVDRSAERSEESVLKTQLIFSKKNGFISHVVDGSDDYGVDINCQLVLNGNATPYQFPIQVKSKISYKEVIVNNKRFKVCPFLTSRLGFLIRDTLTGYIVIYDDNSEELFFDLASEQYNRLRELRDDDSWKKQDSVSLHIPVNNKLNKGSIYNIHSRLANHFHNYRQLLTDHGLNYNLPVVLEISDTKSPKEILVEYGKVLFEGCKYRQLIELLERLDRKSLRKKHLCYLGAITYAEVGDVVESDYFFRLCDRIIREYSVEEKQLLDIQRFKLEYYAGKMTRSELRGMLEKLSLEHNETDYLLALKVNISGIDLLDFEPNENFDEEFINSLESLIVEIEKSNQPANDKQIQLMNVANILMTATNGIITQMFLNTHISNALLANPMTPDRIQKSERIRYLSNLGQKYLISTLEFAENTNSDYMKAYANYYSALAYFGHCYAYFQANIKWESESSSAQILEQVYRNAIRAFNLFIKLGISPLASKAIFLADEIYLLSDKWATHSLEHVLERSKVKKAIENFSKTDFRKPDGSIVEAAEKMIKSAEENLNKEI